MARPDDARILNHATSQDDRRAGAPAPETVAVDGRSLAELLAFSVSYGGLIHFYDLDNVPRGDWAAFFASDPAILDALHASLNLSDIEQIMRQLLVDARDAIDHPGRLEPLKRLFKIILRLLAILDRAHIGLASIEVALKRYLPGRRGDSLAAPLQQLHGHFGGKTLEQGLGNDPDDGRDGKWHGTLIEILEDLVETLVEELQNGMAQALVALKKSLEKADHQPQNAVYIAFVRLFIESRKEMNKFPRRLVDYYYKTVLEQHSLAPKADQTFLTFTCAQGATDVSVPRGTPFPAGTDSSGAAINYAATTSLEVKPAAVSGISVHRVAHVKGVQSGVLTGEVKLDPSNPAAPTPFPMFGDDDTAAPTKALTMRQAEIGFCITSPVLMLMGGHRTVEIGMVVSFKPPPHLTPHPTCGTEPPAPQQSDVDGLALIIEKSLKLHYSTAGGWMRVEKFHVTPTLLLSDRSATLYTIGFVLPPDAPPLVSVTEKPAPDAPKPTRPASDFPEQPTQPAVIANLDLDGEAQIGPAFALLSALEFDHIYLDVFVEGFDQLTLTTPNGPADTTQNFPVFGLPPAQYSTLDIYAPELFVKPIEKLSIAISWAGLPVTSTGFQGYYQNYKLDADGQPVPAGDPPLFDNTSFRIAFSVDNPGYWDVAIGPQPYLFQTGPDISGTAPPPSWSGACQDAVPPAPAGKVRRVSWLDVPGIGSRSAPPYYNSTTSALRLSLAAPQYAFGNILYSSNLMAASMAQTQAALEKACKHKPGRTEAQTQDAQTQITKLAQVNATAPDKTYAQSVSGAVKSAVSSLTGEAVAAVQQGVAQSNAAPETKAWWLTDLENAISSVAGSKGSLWDRLVGKGGVAADVAALVDRVKAWIAEHEADLGEHAAPEIGRAQGLLSAASTVATTHSATVGQPPAVARPKIAATTQQAQVVILPSPLPNPPWLPMASSLTVNYTASVNSPITAIIDQMPASSGSATIMPAVSGDASDPIALDFWHIGPFGTKSTPSKSSGGSVQILPSIRGDAALYIQLSAPASPVTLLFVLAAGAHGWWDAPPKMIWEEHVGGVWLKCTVLDDTTQGLKNSGIVTLAPRVLAKETKAPRLRVRAHGRADNAPTVQCVIANALLVQWEGPGGAAGLGTPLPAGTISKSQDKLAGVASIAQPMDSYGGSPPAVGPAFQMWMAERLRHKGYAIDEWDHARIVLAAVPSLWQAAVVPAVNAITGERAPGKVWIVAVAGPDSPNIADKRIPQVDLSVLSEIGDTLSGCTSSFAEIAVTNPPYLPLCVVATVDFTDDNTPAFWQEQLNTELIEWLSPWRPSAALGPRPSDYYRKRAIAEFIRARAYVLGITRLEVFPQHIAPGNGYFYFTSAPKHHIATNMPGGLTLPPLAELFPGGDPA